MLEEIGGFLELESFSGSAYYPEAVGLNNARNALLYILKARRIHKIYIPCFLCDAVSHMLKRERMAFGFYHVGENLLPDPSFRPEAGAAVYLVNYYGQLPNESILRYRDLFGTVIVDNVQAFFQPPADGVDTVYSCRKFFGVPDGGYAATSARIEETLETQSVMDRMQHLLGRFETGRASTFYPLFQKSEAEHDEASLRMMSRISRNLLCAVDYDRVRTRREENYATLAMRLNGANGIAVSAPVGPYAYPFYVEEGDTIRKRLAGEGIYIPTLWPNVAETGNEIERRLAANILPLPCDQRYGAEQMEYLADRVLSCL